MLVGGEALQLGAQDARFFHTVGGGGSAAQGAHLALQGRLLLAPAQLPLAMQFGSTRPQLLLQELDTLL